MSAERHPKGLYVLFFTEMWERFGFYSMLAMFVLYLRDDKQGFDWSAEQATGLYANYLMFVYASPLIGGWIADKKLGYKNSVLLGGLIFMVGYFLFAIRSIEAVYAALVCLVVGNGFFKPNVSAMVGHLYPEGSALKDRAYNIFYMGINIGALLAPINAELMVNGFSLSLRWLGVSEPIAFSGIGYNWAFAIAGVGMIFSVAILWTFQRHVSEGHKAAVPATAAGAEDMPVAAPRPNPIAAVPDRTRILALVVIFLIVIVFWMVFHQNGSTLTYWADDNTEWNVSGIISNAINAAWVVVLTFPLVWFWKYLADRGLEPSTPTKMTLGMFLTAASFVILYFAARQGETQEITDERLQAGAYRITDRALNKLKADLEPDRAEAILAELRQKNAKGNYVIKGKKFTTDQTYEDALGTIRGDFAADAEQARADLRRHREEDKELQKLYYRAPSAAAPQADKQLKAHREKTKAIRERVKRAEADVKSLKDVKIARGQLLAVAERGDGPDKKFAAALDEVISAARAEGLSSEGAETIRAAAGRTFTGREKFHRAVARRSMLGVEDAKLYGPKLEQYSYLFRVSPWWLIIAYMVVTLGELMLSPMGLSLVSKVAPVHLRGLMMGGWFVATAIGNKLTMIGVYWDVWLQSNFFALLAGMALFMAFVLVVLLRPLKKAMPGV